MSIVPQYDTVTADADGDAVFSFPSPPQGATWSGSLAIPTAPPTCAGIVSVNGSVVGALNGSGFYGPFTALGNQTVSITVTGMTPDTQYQAVWHADTEVAVTPTPTPAVAVVGVGGGGLAGAAGGVNTALLELAAAASGTFTGLPAMITVWEVGWVNSVTPPSSGNLGFSFSGTTTDVLETVTVQEGGSSRLAGLSASGTGVTAQNNTDETVNALITYSSR